MRRDAQRLADITAAAQAIDDHMARGTLDDDLIFDAIRMRLLEIGEAVKGIDRDLLAEEPSIPWQDIAGMRDHLARRYFDTDHLIISTVITRDLPPLVAAIRRLQAAPTSEPEK